MVISKNYNKNKKLTLSRLFLYSALFFAFFSFFGVYTYKIYSLKWFLLFFVYELIFFCGLKTGKLRLITRKGSRKKDSNNFFYITKMGSVILSSACIISILSFFYFISCHLKIVGIFSFGTYTADIYQEGRTTFEKLTLLLMQMGGETSFLLCSADKTDRYKRLKRLSCITLFLPGLRYLLMGARYVIAVEFLLLFIVKWPEIQHMIKYSYKARKYKRMIVLLGILLCVAFLYLFSSRAIYYTALERKAIYSGDMIMKPFWRDMYELTNGKIDFICTASDYLGEAPYIFAYFCEYRMPSKIFWGQFTFRSIMQIFNNLFHIGYSFGEINSQIASGQYSGMSYIMIADFGITGSYIFAFLFGCFFAYIETNANRSATCNVLLPAIMVMCFFAPIFYFYVGRLDYTVLFCLILTPICLKKDVIKYQYLTNKKTMEHIEKRCC